MRTKYIWVTVFSVTGLLLASCGSTGSTTTSASASGSGGIALGSGVKLGTESNSFGQVLALSSGATLYAFVPDSASVTTCAGACQSVWFPVSSVHIVVGPAIERSRVGSHSRSNGIEQLSYNGYLLYTYAGDTKPGATTGQNLDSFGGRWYVVGVDGKLVTGAAAKTSYGY